VFWKKKISKAKKMMYMKLLIYIC